MNPVDRAAQLIQKGGHAHFIGVGGIGMAGVAFLLKQSGFTVSGCDMQTNRQTEWLVENGVDIVSGHSQAHITDSIDWLIRTTAVPDSHPEVQRAKQCGIPVSRRGEVLPALLRDRTTIAVSGTHGKTTTTAMIAQVLGCGYCVGGEISGTAAVAKEGELMVVEADESDGTVAGYTPDFAIITNIEYDHMEHHASEAAFIGCFEQLVRNTKKRVYFCGADPIARQVCSGEKCEPYAYPDKPIDVPLPGQHNQWNAAAVIKVCRNWLSIEQIVERLKTIQPIRRRFEQVFDSDGIRIVSDYAHHPTEIAALIQTAREQHKGRLLAVFQPHRYTRTRALCADFSSAFSGLDQLWLTPVYAASEAPLAGGTSQDLLAQFPVSWDDKLHLSDSLDAAWTDIQSTLRSGDLLLIIGAGDIEQLAEWAAAFSMGDF